MKRSIASSEKVVAIGDQFISTGHFQSAIKDLPIDFVGIDLPGSKEKQHSEQQAMEFKGSNAVSSDGVVLEGVKDATIIMGHFVPMGAAFINSAPHLKLIAVARTGLENVDIELATSRGIGVVPAIGRNANAVAELQIGLMLAETRNISRADASIKEGRWRNEFPGARIEIGGSTVGMIGFGQVGRSFAKKLAGFEPRILIYDPYVKDEEIKKYGAERAATIDQVFIESDFIALQARLSPETERFINKHHFNLMKPTAYFINVSRSRLVNTADLVATLRDGKISGAGIDVFDSEPLAVDDPLRTLDNVTLTTHFGGDTEGTKRYSTELCANAVRTYFDTGKVGWAVNAKELGWL